eukprot:TRINITY_DN47005_c0_g1_i1.p1 TRINITY_DN47005_c0_g1~~TRINITY_DN47005_c0_g1_i1.p1  ORF type:complete len:978 (+),score=176.82 TRINITY_DN47005_c0_g1_i1:89-2935(+)
MAPLPQRRRHRRPKRTESRARGRTVIPPAPSPQPAKRAPPPHAGSIRRRCGAFGEAAGAEPTPSCSALLPSRLKRSAVERVPQLLSPVWVQIIGDDVFRSRLRRRLWGADGGDLMIAWLHRGAATSPAARAAQVHSAALSVAADAPPAVCAPPPPYWRRSDVRMRGSEASSPGSPRSAPRSPRLGGSSAHSSPVSPRYRGGAAPSPATEEAARAAIHRVWSALRDVRNSQSRSQGGRARSPATQSLTEVDFCRFHMALHYCLLLGESLAFPWRLPLSCLRAAEALAQADWARVAPPSARAAAAAHGPHILQGVTLHDERGFDALAGCLSHWLDTTTPDEVCHLLRVLCRVGDAAAGPSSRDDDPCGSFPGIEAEADDNCRRGNGATVLQRQLLGLKGAGTASPAPVGSATGRPAAKDPLVGVPGRRAEVVRRLPTAPAALEPSHYVEAWDKAKQQMAQRNKVRAEQEAIRTAYEPAADMAGTVPRCRRSEARRRVDGPALRALKVTHAHSAVREIPPSLGLEEVLLDRMAVQLNAGELLSGGSALLRRIASSGRAPHPVGAAGAARPALYARLRWAIEAARSNLCIRAAARPTRRRSAAAALPLPRSDSDSDSSSESSATPPVRQWEHVLDAAVGSAMAAPASGRQRGPARPPLPPEAEPEPSPGGSGEGEHSPAHVLAWRCPLPATPSTNPERNYCELIGSVSSPQGQPGYPWYPARLAPAPDAVVLPAYPPCSSGSSDEGGPPGSVQGASLLSPPRSSPPRAEPQYPMQVLTYRHVRRGRPLSAPPSREALDWPFRKGPLLVVGPLQEPCRGEPDWRVYGERARAHSPPRRNCPGPAAAPRAQRRPPQPSYESALAPSTPASAPRPWAPPSASQHRLSLCSSEQPPLALPDSQESLVQEVLTPEQQQEVRDIVAKQMRGFLEPRVMELQAAADDRVRQATEDMPLE